MKHFGSGSKFCLGEENLFLQDALKKQQKIYFVDQKIGEVNHKTSTWFQGYTSDFFYAEGAVFYAISKKFYKLICKFDEVLGLNLANASLIRRIASTIFSSLVA